MAAEHRWSSWPGAWCLDCGVSDAVEECVAVHNDGLICECGVFMCEAPGHKLKGCVIHKNGPCPTPGAGNFDPYRRETER